MPSETTYEVSLAKLNAYIATHNMRRSQVREMVLKQVCKLSQPFTADELEKVCAAERISLGTVYHCLELFIAMQILHAINRQRGQTSTLYEIIPGRQVNMQFQCGRCGRVVEIRDKAIDHLIRVRKYSNFNVDYYTLLIFGECKHCRRPIPNKDKKE